MMRVLVVDDSRMMRSVIKKALSFAGLEGKAVIEATNGQEALDAFPKAIPHLIVCDVNMPQMDGIEFLRKLDERGELNKVPVVMITSNVNEQVKKTLMQLGVAELIAKPFSVQALHTKLQPYLAAVAKPSQHTASFESTTDEHMPASVALDKAVKKTLDMIAFVEAEQLSEFSFPDEPLVVAEVAMSGLRSGTVLIAATRAVAKNLVATISGRSPIDADDRTLCDGVGEIANVAAGYFIECFGAVSGEGTQFSDLTAQVN